MSSGHTLNHNDFNWKKLKDIHSVRLSINELEEITSVVLEGEKRKCDIVKSLILERVDEMVRFL